MPDETDHLEGGAKRVRVDAGWLVRRRDLNLAGLFGELQELLEVAARTLN